jgi:diguanylate cyclase (GGDEF)-like protein
LRALADHDPLTGLLNRRGMEERLRELSGFLERHEVVVTLALLDVDHFKRVNDEHGHDVGDAVLGEISRELQRVFRDSDYLARWGGEEFLVALTHTDLRQATSVLERLRAEIHGVSVFSVPSITLSMGAAEWRPGKDLNAALKQADVALYEAKKKGRNKLVAAPEVPAAMLPRAAERLRGSAVR